MFRLVSTAIITVCVLVSETNAQLSFSDTTYRLALPDSVKAVQLLVEFNPGRIDISKAQFSVEASGLALEMATSIKINQVRFKVPKNAEIISKGESVQEKKNQFIWTYPWKPDQSYKLLISSAADSAENFVLYSGYLFLPELKLWKYLGTCKIKGNWDSPIVDPAFKKSQSSPNQFRLQEAWVQRSVGGWKNLTGNSTINPVINLYSHVDSSIQRLKETAVIDKAIRKENADGLLKHQDIYYQITDPGKGKQVSVEDTVVAFYKGYLYSNGQIFDQTGATPATFPLKRLIRGWQQGVPLLRIGGKIKLVIPSDLGYSIRTRAAKIPPNSILVFEIEVLDVKSKN